MKLKARLQKMAYNTELSDSLMKGLKDVYVEKCKEYAQQSAECQSLDSTEREDFVNNFVDEYMNGYRSITEFDFLFDPIMEIINGSAEAAIDNGIDIMIENYKESKGE